MIKKLKSLKKHVGFMKYFKNTSWLFAEKILRMVVGLFVGIWVARYLGPEQFGLFSYAQSFVGIFAIIAMLGLDRIVVRELVKDESRRDALMGTTFYLKFMGALIVLLLLLISTMLMGNDIYTNTLIFIIASAMVFQSFNVIDFYFQSEVLSKYVVYVNIFSLFLSSIIKITLILNEGTLEEFAYTIIFDTLVLSLGFIYFYIQAGLSLFSWYFDKVLAVSMLKESYPLILAGVINSVYMRIDQIMIKEMLSVVEVGYYAVAVRLSEAWFGIGIIIANSLFPAIVNAKKVSLSLYYKRIQNLFLFLIIMAYLISLLVYFLSDYIIVILYGEIFMNASSVLVIHIFSAIFVYLGIVSGRWLIIERKVMIDLYRNTLAVVVNISLNFILIEKYGILGAAYASLTAYIVAFYLFDLIRKDTRKIFFLKTKALFIRR